MADAKVIGGSCVRCGKCCIDAPLTTLDIRRIEKETGLGKNDFTASHQAYTVVKSAYHPEEGRYYCMFLDKSDEETSCTIYSKRPMVCKLYPFGEMCTGHNKPQKGVYAVIPKIYDLLKEIPVPHMG